MKDSIGAIILAAGRGKRMQSQDKNKVVFSLGGKPMIVHTIEFVKSLGIETIVVVVGFAKESVKAVLGDSVLYAEQGEQLGTADALRCGLENLPANIENVLVMNGDDSAFYNHDTIEQIRDKHKASDASITFLTTEKGNPIGIGRILRDSNQRVVEIVEEKDATDEEKKIHEINVGCYLFKVDFLKKYLPMLEKSEVTGEYYLTSLINLAAKNHEIVETVKNVGLSWHGVNTPEELEKANREFKIAG